MGFWIIIRSYIIICGLPVKGHVYGTVFHDRQFELCAVWYFIIRCEHNILNVDIILGCDYR